jgi:hypothetical protein
MKVVVRKKIRRVKIMLMSTMSEQKSVWLVG